MAETRLGDEAPRPRPLSVLQAAIDAAWLGELALRDGCAFDPDADVGPWCRVTGCPEPRARSAIDFVCAGRLPPGVGDLGDLGWAAATVPEPLVSLLVRISGRHILLRHGAAPVRRGRRGDPLIRAWMAGAHEAGGGSAPRALRSSLDRALHAAEAERRVGHARSRRLGLSLDGLLFLHGKDDRALEQLLSPPARLGRLSAAVLRRRWRKIADP